MVTEEFGSLLREVRKEKGFTQAELAEEAKLNQSTLSQFEGGKLPNKRQIKSIASALDLDAAQTDQLLLAAEYAPESDFDLFNPTLRSIAAVLQDPTSREVLKPLCGKLMHDFSESWQSFARGKQSQYGRDWVTSVKLCKEAETKLASAVTLIRAYILDTMGTAELHLGNLSEAERLYNQVAGLVSQHDFSDPYIRGLVYTHQGDLYRSQGGWNSALTKYREALGIFDQNGHNTDKARVQRKIGLLHLKMGQWPEAASYLDDSLDIFRRLMEQQSENSLAPYELAKTYMAQGWVHSLKGEWDDALELRKRALDIAKEYRIPGQRISDDYLLLQGHLYYGYDSVMVGELVRAKEHLVEAHKISKGLHDQKEYGLILHYGIHIF
ncbi:hypothetical protein LCGC14_2739030 [marine sediment metagenome]|uniref:HTH cro/C1-type domain-containing protein n=1 Tax=marine sediment metagenome TaxID=412755 RepID=A0A0F8Z529_9ZZZZ